MRGSCRTVSRSSSRALTGNAPQLFEIRSGTLEARAVGLPRTHLLSVSSKGELAVLTNARYKGQRLFEGTLGRMSIEGSPRPWMEGVREADWSPDGTTLAIVHDLGSKDLLEYPIGPVLYETAGYLSDPQSLRTGCGSRSWIIQRGSMTVDGSSSSTEWCRLDARRRVWGEEGLAWSRYDRRYSLPPTTAGRQRGPCR